MSPAFVSSPFGIVQALQPGRRAYSFGSYNDISADTQALVTSVAGTETVATVGLIITSGKIPIVNQLISIVGTQTLTGSPPGTFNVTNAVVTSVSGFNTGDNSVGTVSFAFGSHPVPTTADSGVAILPVPEIGEAVTSGEAGLQFAVPQASGTHGSGNNVSWGYSWASSTGTPATALVELQGADFNQDSQYTTLDSGTLTSSESRPPFSTSGLTGVNFLRVKCTFTGGSGVQLIAKIVA